MGKQEEKQIPQRTHFLHLLGLPHRFCDWGIAEILFLIGETTILGYCLLFLFTPIWDLLLFGPEPPSYFDGPPRFTWHMLDLMPFWIPMIILMVLLYLLTVHPHTRTSTPNTSSVPLPIWITFRCRIWWILMTSLFIIALAAYSIFSQPYLA